jgi:hypothetical protein
VGTNGAVATTTCGSTGSTTTNGITYLAPASSSVSRTLTSKLSDFMSVNDFGADATGIANSANAFQSACTSVAGGVVQVWVPRGTYLLNSSPVCTGRTVMWVLAQDTTLTGAGVLPGNVYIVGSEVTGIGNSSTYTTLSSQSDPSSPVAGNIYRNGNHLFFYDTVPTKRQIVDTNTNVSALLNPPVMRWSSYIFQSSNSTNDYYPVLISPITIIAITAAMSTNSNQASCSVAPVLTLNDGSSDVATLTMGNGAHHWSSTGLSLNVPVGNVVNIRSSGAGTGCGVTSQNLNVAIFYVMQ